jgi:DNA repair photolyase
VSVSVAFRDNETRRVFEANTIATERRIDALHKLKEAGIKTSALICPVIPYITDVFALIESLAPVTETIWIYGLSIQNRSNLPWKNMQDILERHYPDSRKEIEAAIFSRDHSYWTELRDKLRHIQESRHLNLSVHV